MKDDKDEFVIASSGSGRSMRGETYAYALAKAVGMSSLASSMGFGLFPEINKLYRGDKPKTKCLNPECKNMTSHNKGYCSADCFKKSRVKK